MEPSTGTSRTRPRRYQETDELPRNDYVGPFGCRRPRNNFIGDDIDPVGRPHCKLQIALRQNRPTPRWQRQANIGFSPNKVLRDRNISEVHLERMPSRDVGRERHQMS